MTSSEYAFDSSENHEIQSLFLKKMIQENWTKWNLDKHTKCCRARINRRFQKGDEQKIFQAFFKDPHVQKQLGLNITSDAKMEVEFQALATNVLSLSFFDRLEEAGITTPSGHIQRIMDVSVRDILVNDKLRLMMTKDCLGIEEQDEIDDYLNDCNSEHQEIYSDQEKQEFIYQLLRRCVIGGPLCQASDTFTEYQDVTRELYKSFLTIHRNSKTKQPEISSLTYSITGFNHPTLHLFNRDNPFNACFLIIDVNKRWITCLLAPFEAFW